MALRFIDIGANLTDPMYAGVYNGNQKHEPDLEHVLSRSWGAGLQKMIITGGNLEESKKATELAQSNEKLYSTVGCHPTRCLEFEQNDTNPEQYLEQLKQIAQNNKTKVVAIGECGLDYDRIQFCPKDVQKKYFEFQLKLTEELDLPLFLHCRNAAEDLYAILSRYTGLRGVVHSFDGTPEEAKQFTDLGYYIGLNGCSLKTKDNLETVATLPAERILLETDCPWCEVRPTHVGFPYISAENKATPSVKKEKWKPDSMVKARNEPINIRQVLDIVAAVRKDDPSKLCETIFENTQRLFFSDYNKR